MQDQARELWREMAKAEIGQRPEDIDFGWLTSWPYMQAVGPIVIRSNFAALPEPGGLNNQYEDFMIDLSTFMYGLSIEVWEEAQKVKPTTNGAEPSDIPDWRDLG
jgi:hypothetical protein